MHSVMCPSISGHNTVRGSRGAYYRQVIVATAFAGGESSVCSREQYLSVSRHLPTSSACVVHSVQLYGLHCDFTSTYLLLSVLSSVYCSFCIVLCVSVQSTVCRLKENVLCLSLVDNIKNPRKIGKRCHW